MCEIFITGKQRDVHPKQDSRSSPKSKRIELNLKRNVADNNPIINFFMKAFFMRYPPSLLHDK
jgi:hypothetical protein